jgi:hypothetical protein
VPHIPTIPSSLTSPKILGEDCKFLTTTFAFDTALLTTEEEIDQSQHILSARDGNLEMPVYFL